MTQKSLANLLKTIVILAGIVGAVLYLLVFPVIGRQLADTAGENIFWPWMIFLWISAIPCYAVLFKCWGISTSIRQDHSFSMENSKKLRMISLLALCDSIYFFSGNVIFLLLNLSHPVVILASLIIAFIGFAISIAAAALSHLVTKAARIQSENELTI